MDRLIAADAVTDERSGVAMNDAESAIFCGFDQLDAQK
jgi:hypothetical protein